MAARQLTEQTLSSFTIQIYKGIPYTLTMSLDNPNGSPVDLSGKVLSIKFKDVFPTQLELFSDGAPSALGSSIVITDEPEGEFKFTITEAETITADTGSGKWWLQLDDELLWLDNVQVCEI